MIRTTNRVNRVVVRNVALAFTVLAHIYFWLGLRIRKLFMGAQYYGTVTKEAERCTNEYGEDIDHWQGMSIVVIRHRNNCDILCRLRPRTCRLHPRKGLVKMSRQKG